MIFLDSIEFQKVNVQAWLKNVIVAFKGKFIFMQVNAPAVSVTVEYLGKLELKKDWLMVGLPCPLNVNPHHEPLEHCQEACLWGQQVIWIKK